MLGRCSSSGMSPNSGSPSSKIYIISTEATPLPSTSSGFGTRAHAWCHGRFWGANDEMYGIVWNYGRENVCKAVLDCFGRREKDGNMRRNEIVTPSFCPIFEMFIFANMFCHGLACTDCFVNCVTACWYLVQSEVIATDTGTILYPMPQSLHVAKARTHMKPPLFHHVSRNVFVCIWVSTSCIAL